MLSFKPLVKTYLDEYPVFAEDYAIAEKAASKNNPEGAKSYLEKIQELEARSLRGKVAELSARVDNMLVAKRQEEAARLKAEVERKKRHSEQILADASVQEQACLQKYDFQEILSIYSNAKKNAETDTVVRQIDSRLRRAEKMAEFKITLLKDIQNFPFPGGKLKTRADLRLIGSLVKADETDLEFTMEGATIKAKWIDLTPESMLMVGEYYMQKALNEKDRAGAARRAFSLAAFAQAFKMDQKLKLYLGAIHQIDPAMKSDADKMFASLN